MDRRKLLSRGLAAMGLSLIPGTILAGPRLVTPPSDKYIADAIRETVRRMAQDAVGKPEKGPELALLKLYVDTVHENGHAKDDVQIGHGTFTGPTSEYVSIIDVVHWYVYGVWGASHDPTYWAQHTNGEWYLV